MFQDLNPLDRSTAIMEIIIMLLVAFIIGFLIAWWLRRSKKATIDNSAQLADLESDNTSLRTKVGDLETQLKSNDKSAEMASLRSDNDSLKTKIESLESQSISNDNSTQLAGLENDNNALKARISSLESEQDQLQSKNGKLQSDLDACLQSKSTPAPAISTGSISDSDKANAERLGFAAASESDRDDLTRISGVGPFIEKKLNGLGIYTFSQISKFTPDTIERVTDAIQFFPGRIQRDNWVDQAEELKS